jgi:hypothetical protein
MSSPRKELSKMKNLPFFYLQSPNGSYASWNFYLWLSLASCLSVCQPVSYACGLCGLSSSLMLFYFSVADLHAVSKSPQCISFLMLTSSMGFDQFLLKLYDLAQH